ncbi:MAG: M48 family metallopeptidase [Cyanothece sp. SIO1E1]|nr:M48 family metallopeptidase [Cyanothece sp. SIO1E1]
MVNPKKLHCLESYEYQHPEDRKALLKLEKTPGLDKLVKWINDLGFEALLNIEFTGSNIEVTEQAFPDIYDIFESACETLNLDQSIEPKLYFRWNDYFRVLDFPTNNLEGITVGVNSPIIAISTESVENFTDEELHFLIGCEVGRIKSEQILYEDIARLLPVATSAVSALAFGVGAILTPSISVGVHIALNRWLRMADYTADRAGLLACQSVNTALTALAKMAGLPHRYREGFNVRDFTDQARKFEGIGDNFGGKALKMISHLQRDQAFTIARAHELLKWVDSGEYEAVLERPEHLRKILPQPAILYLIAPAPIAEKSSGKISAFQLKELVDEAFYFLCVGPSETESVEYDLDVIEGHLDDSQKEAYIKIHISDGRSIIGKTIRFELKNNLQDSAKYEVEEKACLRSRKGLKRFNRV